MMIKIKIAATAALVFVLQTANAQVELQTGTYGNGDKLVNISLGNLVKLIQMTNVDFEKTMEVYNYKYTEGTGYLWQGGGLMAGYYTITKDPGFAGMVWTERNAMVTQLKDKLEKYYKGYSEGKYIYDLQDNGNSYQIILRSNDDGSGSVSIKKF
jgi:hypothetical protein